ncbi:AI-2E family transporter [Candidatus Parcubacteria bacterium]|nr:MAG: AI-2E family transporter [Candidatus Parcubacteria bacterium]
METHKFEVSFFITVLLLALGLVVLVISPYFQTVVISAMVAIVFRPLHRYFAEKLPRHTALAALLSLMVVLVVVLLPLTFFGFQIFREAVTLYAVIAEGGTPGGVISSTDTFVRQKFFEPFFDTFPALRGAFLAFDTRQHVEALLGWVVENIGSLFSGVARITLNVLLGLLGLYYFFKDGARFKEDVIHLIPLRNTYGEKIFEQLAHAVGSVMKGTLVVALLQGILVGLGFFVFGIPSPALWGSVGVLAALVPNVGTALVTVPAVLYLLLGGELGAALGLLVWGLLIVGLIDNFLRPYLITKGISLHPFLILLGALGGIRLFGPLGFLFGPLVLSLFFALVNMYPVLLKEEK